MMLSLSDYQLLADIVLLLHFSIVIFVVGGLVLIIIGNLWAWHWVNHLWLRVLHLLAIGVVMAESWLGITCPLTTLEWWLREQAGVRPENISFIEYWVQRILFYNAPSWVFTGVYTLFGSLVAATWWLFPPKGYTTGNKNGA
jgi:polyferredoxin